MSVAKLINCMFSFTQCGFHAQASRTGYGITPQPRRGKPSWMIGLGVAAGAMLLAALGAENIHARPDQEISLLSHLAEAGDAGAQLQLGLAYREGRYGLRRDAKTGLHWLTQAAANGQSYAADLVGTAYADGQGTTRDPGHAQHWWTVAAKDGNAHAAWRLGEQLASSDPSQAEHWLKQAAEQGNQQAAQILRTLYAHQIAPANDLQLGKSRLGVIAAQTDSLTLKTLEGAWDLLLKSTAAAQDTNALRSDALAGDPTAEFQLGMRYRDGAWGVARDPVQARYWLRRAANNGNRLAAHALDESSHG